MPTSNATVVDIGFADRKVQHWTLRNRRRNTPSELVTISNYTVVTGWNNSIYPKILKIKWVRKINSTRPYSSLLFRSFLLNLLSLLIRGHNVLSSCRPTIEKECAMIRTWFLFPRTKWKEKSFRKIILLKNAISSVVPTGKQEKKIQFSRKRINVHICSFSVIIVPTYFMKNGKLYVFVFRMKKSVFQQ